MSKMECRKEGRSVASLHRLDVLVCFVFPGDPLRFHAHFICVCVRADERVPLSDLLTAARLGSNVKKTLILCSPHCHGGGVTYSSLQWSGMI